MKVFYPISPQPRPRVSSPLVLLRGLDPGFVVALSPGTRDEFSRQSLVLLEANPKLRPRLRLTGIQPSAVKSRPRLWVALVQSYGRDSGSDNPSIVRNEGAACSL